MKSKKYYILFLVIIFLMSKSLKAEASSLYGEGTKDNPYQINTVNDFIAFEKEVNAGNTFAGCYIEQNANLNFEKVSRIAPIGNPIKGTAFAGTYNGKGHFLENVNIRNVDYAAIFGQLSGGIENLGIESGNINGVYAAGIAAFSYGNDARIINCYNKASVEGDRASGIADQFSGSIINCWNIGKITANDTQYSAGIVSSSANQVIYCYSVERVLSERAMVSCNYYCDIIDRMLPSNFIDELNENLIRSIRLHVLQSDETVFWKYEEENKKYGFDIEEYEKDDALKGKNKIFRASPKGTSNDPINLNELEDMVLLRYAVDSGMQDYENIHLELKSDIDFKECKNWNPIGDVDKRLFFSGKLNGNGKKIINLTSRQKNYAGLFELLSGEVYNLQLADVNIYGSYASGIACIGYNNPSIYNCSVSGTIRGNKYAGGIANELGKGRILNCLTYLTATNNIAGICSKSCDTVEYCYSNLPLFSDNYKNYIRNENGNILYANQFSGGLAEELNIKLARNKHIPFERVKLWRYDTANKRLIQRDSDENLVKASIWFGCYGYIYALTFIFVLMVVLYICSRAKKETSNQYKRNEIIDVLRLFFSVGIILLHWGQWNGDEKLFVPCGYIGVSFFYIVSGYLLAQKVYIFEQYNCERNGIGKETVNYIVQKIKRILPYYIITLIMSFISVSYFTYSSKEQLLYNLGCYISEILMLQMTGFPTYAIIGTEWYLSALIISLLIVYPLVRKNRQFYSYIISPLIGIMGLGWIGRRYGNFASPASWTGICFEGVLRAVALISLGVAAFEICRLIKEKHQNLSVQLTLVEVIVWVSVFVWC